MAIAGQNANYDNLTTMTINRWLSSNLSDHIASHHPLWFRMMEQGNIVQGGNGYFYVEPVKWPAPGGPQVQGVTEDFNELAPAVETGGITAYQWKPAEFAMLTGIREYDLSAQGSMTEKVNLTGEYMGIWLDKYLEFLNGQMWAAEGAAGADGQSQNALGSIRCYVNGGGSSTTGGGFVTELPEQLTVAIGTSPITKVGNIERNAAGGAYFTPATIRGSLASPGTAIAVSSTLLNEGVTMCTRGKDSPDYITMGRNPYNYYMGVLQNQIRFTGGSALADVGFKNSFVWRGCDVVFDDLCPQVTNLNQIFFLNTKYLKLRYNTMKPVFRMVDTTKLIKQWKSSQILQMTSNQLGRLQGRISSILDG